MYKSFSFVYDDVGKKKVHLAGFFESAAALERFMADSSGLRKATLRKLPGMENNAFVRDLDVSRVKVCDSMDRRADFVVRDRDEDFVRVRRFSRVDTNAAYELLRSMRMNGIERVVLHMSCDGCFRINAIVDGDASLACLVEAVAAYVFPADEPNKFLIGDFVNCSVRRVVRRVNDVLFFNERNGRVVIVNLLEPRRMLFGDRTGLVKVNVGRYGRGRNDSVYDFFTKLFLHAMPRVGIALLKRTYETLLFPLWHCSKAFVRDAIVGYASGSCYFGNGGSMIVRDDAARTVEIVYNTTQTSRLSYVFAGAEYDAACAVLRGVLDDAIATVATYYDSADRDAKSAAEKQEFMQRNIDVARRNCEKFVTHLTARREARLLALEQLRTAVATTKPVSLEETSEDIEVTEECECSEESEEYASD